MSRESASQRGEGTSSAAPLIWAVLLLGTIFILLQPGLGLGQMEVQCLTLLAGLGGLLGFWLHGQRIWGEVSRWSRGLLILNTLLPATLLGWGLLAAYSLPAAVCSQVLIVSLLLLLLPAPQSMSPARNLPTLSMSAVETSPVERNVQSVPEPAPNPKAQSIPISKLEASDILPLTQTNADQLVLRLNRLRTVNGSELVEGMVRLEFASGETLSTVHVTLTPPLAGIPEVDLIEDKNSTVRVKVAARYPFGLRLEGRRRGPELPALSLLLSFKVTSQAERKVA